MEGEVAVWCGHAVLDKNGHAIMDNQEDKDEVYFYFWFKYDLDK